MGRLFVKLGVIGFGGPAAHIALMRDEVVRRRRWVSDGEFLELVAACNLIPGPNSTELAIELGRRRAGWRGLLVAGLGFILPAAAIVAAVAVLYRRWGRVPGVLDVRDGVLPVVVALVAAALWSLARATVRSAPRLVAVVGVALAWLAGVGELPLLAVAAAAGGLWAAGPRIRRRMADLRDARRGRRRRPPALGLWLAVAASGGAGVGPLRLGRLGPWARPCDPGLVVLATQWAAATPARPPVGLGRLFLVFLKVGALLYGSGYVLLSFLQRDLVEGLGWLSEAQLLDAVAVGQLTPGPLFTTATFVGYQLAGPAGAAVATVAIFLPSFLLVAALGRLVDLARRRPWAAGALDGVSMASLGLFAGVAVRLADAALPGPLEVILAVAAGVLASRWRVGSAWLVGGGAVIGLVAGWVG